MKNKQHDWKFILQFLLTLTIFLFAVVRIGMFYWEYSKGAKEYQNLQDAVIFSEEESPTDTESDEFAIDFEKLQKINPDIVGWIHLTRSRRLSIIRLYRERIMNTTCHIPFTGRRINVAVFSWKCKMRKIFEIKTRFYMDII